MTIGDWISSVIGLVSIIFASIESYTGLRSVRIALQSLRDTESHIKKSEKQSKFVLSMKAIKAFNNKIWPEYCGLYASLISSDEHFNYDKALTLLSDLNTWSLYITSNQTNDKLVDSVIRSKQRLIYSNLKDLINIKRKRDGNESVSRYIAIIIKYDLK